MSFEHSHAERQRRIDEICGLQHEPEIDAWKQIEIGCDEENGANELGFPTKYFCKLVSEEFVYKLNNGVSFAEFPKFPSALEDQCWRTVCRKVESNLSETIETSLCKQLRLKLLLLYKGGISIGEIAQRFDLKEKQVKTLIALAFAEDGLTLGEIGAELHVTSERARQIIKALGVSIRTIRQQQSHKVVHNQATLRESIDSWIKAHPGCYLSEATSALNVVEADVLKLCPQTLKRLVLGGKTKRDSDNHSTYSKEQILEALRKAYESRNPSMSMYSVNETQPLTGPYYDDLQKKGTIYGPSRPRILQIFGTWKAACEEAGVPSVDAVRDVYELRWTDEELIEQLAEFISSTESPVAERFDEWCRLDDSRPSYGTIRNQIGPWFESCELALLYLRQQWTNE